MSHKHPTHRQRAELPQRVTHRLDLRQGSRTDPIPSRRRDDVRGGRQGVRNQLRGEL
jgi:hypothetical protein